MTYTIRAAVPADAEAIARVQVAGWHSTYTGLMPDGVLADQTVERRQPMWARMLSEPETFKVYTAEASAPEDGNDDHHHEAAPEMVGIVSGGEPQSMIDGLYHGFDCEVYALYIMKAHQGHGLGRRLLQQMMVDFASVGKSAMLLWVLDDNHAARRFYERMGGVLLELEKPFDAGEMLLREVAYGWHDLGTNTFNQ